MPRFDEVGTIRPAPWRFGHGIDKDRFSISDSLDSNGRERDVDPLRAVLQSMTPATAHGMRQRALDAVTSWHWTTLDSGPGLGDIETDLRGGQPFPWLNVPPQYGGNERYGLDARGRVRVVQRRTQANDLVVEYLPSRVRKLIVDDSGPRTLEDVVLDGGRYVTAISVSTDVWSHIQYDYNGDQFRSMLMVMEMLGPLARAPMASVYTAKYDRDGRFRSMPSKSVAYASLAGIEDYSESSVYVEVDVTGSSLLAEEEAFADALTRAIVADVAAYPPNGALARFVLRWFEWRSPEYITLHALGTEDDDDHDDAWLPLEWSNLDEEMQRTQRICEHPEVVRTAALLGPIYDAVDNVPDEHPPPPALRSVIQRLPAALATLPQTDYFAAAASHFEAYGMLISLKASNSPHVVEALAARDEVPPDE